MTFSNSTPLRVLYLQGLDSIAGRDALQGRRLHDAFKGVAEECLLAHRVFEEAFFERIREPESDLISTKTVQLLRPNVIYLERGLFTLGGDHRIDPSVAQELIRGGTVLIAADVDLNQLYNHWKGYQDASRIFKARPKTSDGSNPIALVDLASNAGSAKEILCMPDQMIIEDWLKPLYDGISRIVAGAPAELDATYADILATGNRETIQAEGDYGAESTLGAFATVCQQGHGFAVLIAAGVTSDVWTRFAPDNTRWLVNVASHLVGEVQRNLARRHHLTSGHTLFLSHRSVDKALVAEVSQHLRGTAIGTWLDRTELVPGDSLVSEINRGLESMTAFVLFWSATCVDAPWVGLELDAAIARLTEKRVPILIVRLDPTPVPAIVAHLHRIEAEGLTGQEIATMLADAINRRAQRGR